MGWILKTQHLPSTRFCLPLNAQDVAPESSRVCLEIEWRLEKLKEVPRKVCAWGSCWDLGQVRALLSSPVSLL